MTRFLRDRGAATAVEFALVVVPLLTMIFGVVEFSRLLWTRNALEEGAIAGARCMGIGQLACSTSGGADAAKTAAFVKLTVSQLSIGTAVNVSVGTTTTCAGAPGFVSVTVASNFTTVVPLIRQFIGANVPLSATSCFPTQS